jgi:hypothetical protein
MFVTTLETQKKKALFERRMRTEIYQQGFLKIVKFSSWHGGQQEDMAGPSQSDLECLKVLRPRMYC